MKTEISEYEQQAIDFTNKIGIEVKAEFIKNDTYFDEDKETRDIYKITLSGKDRFPISFNFGQSLNASGKYKGLTSYFKKITGHNSAMEIKKEWQYRADALKLGLDYKKNENYAIPNAYDVLCCLTKYDPGSFEDFCSDFGYDQDSRKAEKTYKAVVKEWEMVKTFFRPSEIEELQEIQ